MAEYHVGCGIAGIYAGRLNKDGYSWIDKSEVTEEAIHAVMAYLLPDANNKVKSVISTNRNGGKIKLSCQWINDREETE